MPAQRLDDFVESLTQCATEDELFSVYRSAIFAEGFQNVAFSRLDGKEFVDAPIIDAPEGIVGVYFNENFAESDPVLEHLNFTNAPFTWKQATDRAELNSAARNVMEVCREFGVQNGVAIPVHGPGKRCDIFSLSYREKRTFDPARWPTINMKTYATWLRFNELEAVRQAAEITLSKSSETSTATDRHTAHRDGLAKISEQECRALVIADIAYRRHRAGLTELNDNLPRVIGAELFDRLKDRGLVCDEPDDARWRFVARPSPIGCSHLRCCPAVSNLRDQIWPLYVRQGERPA